MEGEFPEEMKCPVCFEIPEKEIFQCENGHTLCEVCVKSISLCPQCRVDLESRKIRNRALEDLLDMMKLDCTNKSKGCTKKVTRRTITSHSDNCDFGGESAPFCKYIGFECDYLINIGKIKESVQHLIGNHPCVLQSGSEISIRLGDFSTTDVQGKSTWQPIILQAFDQNIAFITQSDEKHISLASILLGAEHTKKLQVKFCILSQLKKKPALQWITDPTPISQAEDFLKFPPFHLSLDFLDKTYLENGNLVVNVLVVPQNSVINMSGKKVAVEIYRTIKPASTKSIYPEPNTMTNYSMKNRTRFEDILCDNIHEHTIRFLEQYQCLECVDYKQCNSCNLINENHAFHHFAVIKRVEQYALHQRKTMNGVNKMPHVKCLKKTFYFQSNRLSAHIISTQENLRCAKCSNKAYFICLFCPGPYSLCPSHDNTENEISHYFGETWTEDTTQFLLKILECENLL